MYGSSCLPAGAQIPLTCARGVTLAFSLFYHSQWSVKAPDHGGNGIVLPLLLERVGVRPMAVVRGTRINLHLS
jgi:hypothetical protein